jgi:hypothetical protein
MVVANDDINTTNPENPDRQDVYRGGRLNDPYRDNPYLGPAGVKFNAKRGTTYYIAVSGTHKNNGSVLAQGPIVLSWAYHSSGVFRFSKNFYLCTEAESDDPQDGSTSPSPRGLRVTVNRLFGAKGKVVVSFDFTDGLARLGRDYKAPSGLP